MQEFTLDTLAQRMNRLELEVRRWRLGATILLICAVAGLVMGQTLPKPQVIEARRFILKSPDGKVHAILGLYNPDRDGPSPGDYYPETTEAWGAWGLHIFGSDTKYRAGLMSYSEEGGGGYLKLSDKNTESRVDLHVGSAFVDLSLLATTQTHEEQERRSEELAKKQRAAKTPQETEAFWTLASEPPPGVSTRLNLDSKGHTALTLSEKGGSEVVLGHIGLQKPHGVVEQRSLSSLVFFDKDGEVIWKAP